MGNYKAIALFILVGYLVFCFNKNMIVVLLTPLILTSIFMAGGIMREGVDETLTHGTTQKTTDPKKMTTATPNATPNATPDPKKMTNATPTTTTDSKKMTTTTTTKTKKGGEMVTDGTEEEIKTEDETGEPVGDASTNAENGMTTMYKKGNRIDYASTVEDAYGDLNNLLGGDGIKRLTDDTQKLMGQQMQLAEAMKSMTPLLSQAKSLMAGFDMKQFGDITTMAKQFGAAK